MRIVERVNEDYAIGIAEAPDAAAAAAVIAGIRSDNWGEYLGPPYHAAAAWLEHERAIVPIARYAARIILASQPNDQVYMRMLLYHGEIVGYIEALRPYTTVGYDPHDPRLVDLHSLHIAGQNRPGKQVPPQPWHRGQGYGQVLARLMFRDFARGDPCNVDVAQLSPAVQVYVGLGFGPEPIHVYDWGDPDNHQGVRMAVLHRPGDAAADAACKVPVLEPPLLQ